MVRSISLKGIKTTCRYFETNYAEVYSVKGLTMRLYMEENDVRNNEIV